MHIKDTRCSSPEINSSNNVWQNRKKIYSKFWSFYIDKQRLWPSLFLEILQAATIIGIHCWLFQGIMSYSKFWKNCLWWSHFLIKTQNYGLQLRTLLNSITHDFMTIFRNSCTENSRKFPRKHQQLPFKEITWLQSAAYNWTKTSITDTSLEVPRRERML